MLKKRYFPFRTYSELMSIRNLCVTCTRNSSKALSEAVSSDRWKYKLDQKVEEDLMHEIYKPRHHPGINQPRTVTMPDSIIKAVRNVLEDQNHPRAQLLKSSEKFVRQLHERKPPMEQEDLENKIEMIKEKVIRNIQRKKPNLENDTAYVKNHMKIMLGKLVYNWSAIKYDHRNSLMYLVGRSSAEYSVINRIFSEIHSRNPKWKPKSLFDFGSGVGTVTWAANNIWPGSFLEYFNVDTSSAMNELSEHLLKSMKAHNRSVYYRQFLPATPVPFDLVVSAYSLMELPSLKSRLETIRTLWNKTTEYLIIVEQGTRAGYKIINEARDFILSLNGAHAFSPCPNDGACPRFVLNDGTPCNFEVSYHNNMPLGGNSQWHKERYSYVVLKRDPRDGGDSNWPRLVRPTLLRHKHCVCTLCTSEGSIEHSFFTASKYGQLAYRCAKATDWGDRLPMVVKQEQS